MKDLVFFQNIVIFLSISSGVIVFLFFIFQKQSKELKKLKWLVLFYVFSGFLIDLLLNLFQVKNVISYNGTLYNLYSFSAVLFLLFIFRQLPLSSMFKTITSVVYGLFLMLFCVSSFYAKGFTFNNVYYSIFLSVSTLFFVLYYFFWKFNFIGTISITKEYTFWFFTALFVYFGIPLVLEVSPKLLTNVDPIAFGYLWQIMNFSTVLFHLLIAKMLWVMKMT